MRKLLKTIFGKPVSRPEPEDLDLLFEGESAGIEVESAPQSMLPQWARSMILPILVLFCVLGLVYLQQQVQGQRAGMAQVRAGVDQLSHLTHRIDDLTARAAIAGFGGMGDLASGLESSLGKLKAVAATQGPTAFPVAPLNGVEARWRALDARLAVVEQRATSVKAVRQIATDLSGQLDLAVQRAAALSRVLADIGANAADVGLAGRLRAHLIRMSADAALLGTGADPGSRHSRSLAVELDAFVSDLGRLSGLGSRIPDASGKADEVGGLVTRLETQAPLLVERGRILIAAAPDLTVAREAFGATHVAAEGFMGSIEALREAYADAAASRPSLRLYFDALAALTIILIAMFGLQVVGTLRARAREAAAREAEVRERNRRNQDAILQLLDEISGLADGDLTRHTTVSEEITGAVADAVNYAIDALRDLVSRINKTAEAVANSAKTTRSRTSKISRASHTQASQIVSAAHSVQAMADAGRQMSDHAASSSEVARRSLGAAARGAAAVRETISGMEEIRDAIQDTAKRLKRLGESSQEIGNIVGLIDDIADQTNVLALNAAIQASMAGEAGRGFGVVADEVQRLAERARQATKRIEVLVLTIQSDTHEAIASMEQSTTGVVSGARLAEDAGGSLREIEDVSHTLAARIHGISSTASDQADRAATLAAAMQALQNFAVQVRSGTNVTAKSADRLAEFAQALEASVSRFRLPSTDQGNVVDLIPGGADADLQPSKEQGRERGRV